HRDGGNGTAAQARPGSFERTEVKSLVLADRAPDGPAELALLVGWLARPAGIRKEVRAVERRVPQELEGRSMNRVSARLDADEHLPAHSRAILCGEVAGD